MAEAAKYLFDRNLEETDTPEVLIKRQLRQVFERELAAARQSEYERGRSDGSAAALESLEASTDEAVGQLVDRAAQILAGLDKECSVIRSDGVMVALAASELLAGDLVRSQPIKLLESLFSQCLEHLSDAPHIAIRVSDAFAEQLQKKVAAIAEQRGFTGKMIVLGDPESLMGECRIEWADGGISRNLESLRENAKEIVSRHLETHRTDEAEPEAPANSGRVETPVMPPVIPGPLPETETTQPNNAGEIP